jgi:hypothetical protein
MTHEEDPHSQKPSKPSKPQSFTTGSLRLSSSNLQKVIFESDHPEQLIRTFPAQSLYMAVRQAGLSSSVELILAATIDQCRIMTDLDLWNSDRFEEENFWEWLRLPDACDDLRILQKFLGCTDLKLVALMISRHVDSVVHEEATDAPPGEGFYTPDKGHSWLRIKTEDADQHFLLGRFLALLFETNTKVFYQLLATPAVATDTVLEEDSYQEKNKRLTAEGIPDRKYAEETNAPLLEATVREILSKDSRAPVIEDISAVTPFIHDTLNVQPLSGVLSQLSSSEEFARALTHIMNSAIVQWNIPFYETEVVEELMFSVKGALNIGLERLQEIDNRPLIESARALGWKNTYRLGRSELVTLQKFARSLPESAYETNQQAQTVIEGLVGALPYLPAFFRRDGSFDEDNGRLATGTRAIETLEDIASVRKYLENLQIEESQG